METQRPFDSETCGYISVLFLTASLVAGFISIFNYIFAYVSIVSFILGIIFVFYSVSIKYK